MKLTGSEALKQAANLVDAGKFAVDEIEEAART